MDIRDTIEAVQERDELRDFARVVKAALGVIVGYWVALGLTPQHPYRQAVRMVISYLEGRYGI